MEAHSGLSARIVQEAGTYLAYSRWTAEITWHDNTVYGMRQWNALHFINVWFHASKVTEIQQTDWHTTCTDLQNSLSDKPYRANRNALIRGYVCVSACLLLLTKLLHRLL
jgi:hypothetical protein